MLRGRSGPRARSGQEKCGSSALPQNLQLSKHSKAFRRCFRGVPVATLQTLSRDPPMWKLVIEDDEGKRTVVPLARDDYTIGRQEGNTIRLTERNVSRHHGRVRRSRCVRTDRSTGSFRPRRSAELQRRLRQRAPRRAHAGSPARRPHPDRRLPHRSPGRRGVCDRDGRHPGHGDRAGREGHHPDGLELPRPGHHRAAEPPRHARRADARASSIRSIASG